MKKHKSIITAVAFILILAAFVVAMFVDALGPLITSITSTVITVVGALVIWVQFKRDGELASIDIVSQLNKLFVKSDGLMYLREKLMKTSDPKEYSDQGMLKGKDITYLPDSYINEWGREITCTKEQIEDSRISIQDTLRNNGLDMAILKDINEIENNTIRAIWLMLKLMKMQLFNDGNKRTAMLVTNYCGLRVRLNLPVIEKFL